MPQVQWQWFQVLILLLCSASTPSNRCSSSARDHTFCLRELSCIPQPMPVSKDIGNWHAFEYHCTLDTDSFKQVCRVNKHGNVEIYRCDICMTARAQGPLQHPTSRDARSIPQKSTALFMRIRNTFSIVRNYTCLYSRTALALTSGALC